MENILNKLNIILSATNPNGRSVVVKNINKIEFKKLINSDYSEAYNAYKNKSIIYRGIKPDIIMPDISIQTPGDRISENTINLYTRLFSDILPSWKDYPKRSQSFICTTSLKDAEAYGAAYITLPINGTKIGVCQESDIWYSFSNVSEDFYSNLNTYISKIYGLMNKIANIKKDDLINMNNNELINVFNIVTEVIKNPKYAYTGSNEIIRTMINEIKNTGISMLDYLNTQLSPYENYFQLVDINNYNITTKDTVREVWFSAPAIFVSVDKKILQK
jgi:hypothetical protein